MKSEQPLEKTTPYLPHEGHRSRVQERFLKNGIEEFRSHEILELILFFSIHRGDTNELAHRLIEQFGSLSGVFHAPYEELLRVKGIGKISALLLKLIPQVCRAYYEDCHKEKVRVFEVEQAVDVLRRKYIGRTNEVVVLLLLDSQCRLILCEVVNEGTVNTVPIYVRRIVELAVRYNASAAILSHNHPSGNPVPSKGDIESTISVYHALKAVNVPLRDHIIFGDQDYISLSHLGILTDIMEPF